MILQGRNLTQGLTGADVADLQSELTQLTYTVPASEQSGSSFGTATLAAVKQFQTDRGVAVTGIVDADTAAALSEAIAECSYVVSGVVSSATSAGVAGLTVQLQDKNVGSSVVVASGRTTATGAYKLKAVISPNSLKGRNKPSADLQVQVLTGTTVLAASEVRYNAPLSFTLNISLPANVTGLPSEYETLIASLSVLYKGQLGALQEGAEQQDITYLANKSGWDARAVAMAALADQFSQITTPNPPGSVSGATGTASTTSTTPAPVSLAPEFYYALFRAGLAAEQGLLFRTPSQTVQAVWERAITQGVVPQTLSSQVSSALVTYQTLAGASLLTAAAAIGVSNLGALLSVRKLSAEQQTTFSQLFAQYGSDPTALWSNVTKSLGATVTAQLQLDGQMFCLTLNNAPVVTALYAAEPKLASVSDLASLGYYNASKWVSLIGNSVPGQIPGQGATDYAAFLAAQVRLSFPTGVAADQVRVGVFPISDSATVATNVAAFLNANSSDFAIGAEPVEAYIARSKGSNAALDNVDAAVVAQVKRLQRVYQLTPDDNSMAVLLRHNLDSAYAITRYDAPGFQRAFGAKLGGGDQAAQTYARAQHVLSSTLNIAMGYLTSRRSPVLGGVSTILNGFPAASSQQTYPVVAYPTLESLFGSLDYCSCEDCRSILSPAAYLVDLLHYLDQPSPSPGFSNPQSVLFQRRPDLQYLPLTCENTNTALPYIDVVNEALEYFVATPPANIAYPLGGFQGYSTDDTVTSAELIASPQFVNDAAYAVLQSAYLPPPLPFNRSLLQLRLLFQNMGAALPDVMTALRTNDSIAIASGSSGYSAADILIEQLGISRDEYRVLTDSTVNLPSLYGYSSTTAFVTLQSITLQELSRRTAVSYADLVSIFKTQFLNPNAVLIERLERLSVPFSMLTTLNSTPSTATAFIQNLPAGLDARAYGGSSPTDTQAVVNWVLNPTNFKRITSIITLADATSGADPCSGSSFELQYANGKLLTQTDFTKLIRFIRLWQKLGLSIEQTDDILSALYPALDLPTQSTEAANLLLLDAGFKTALLRIGTLFQVMDALSLTADKSLGPLLACWSTIGTVGDNALYQQMFSASMLQREDPGVPVATIAGAPNGGDVLTTIVNSLALPLTVSAGDTPATIAGKIVALINGTTLPDPLTGVPLNERIYASSQDAAITVRAGVTVSCSTSPGSTEILTPLPQPPPPPNSPLSQTLGIGGKAKAGDVLAVVIDTVVITYTVEANDNLNTIAAGIASAINNTNTADPYSGLPLSSLLIASSSGSVVAVNCANAGGPLSLTCSSESGATGSYVAGAPTTAYQTATVGGTIASGDVLTTTINGLAIPFTVSSQTTAAVVATAVAAAINSTTAADPNSGLPVNSILHATANGAVVMIAADDPATAISVACTQSGAITYTQGGPFPSSQSATVGGSFSAGAVLSTTVNGVTVPYTVLAGETAASIATNIANAIKAAGAEIDPETGVALDQLVSSTAAGAVVTLTAPSSAGSFTLAVTVQSGVYTAGLQPSPFADNGYGDFLADPTQTVFGHEPVLRAAFNLSGAEFTEIANALQFTASAPLTLNNISSIFRFGWFAHSLNMSIVEFLLMRQMTGLDPFATLDPDPGTPPDPPVIRFIALVQAMTAAGLLPVQALYLLWNQDISGKSSPNIGTVTGLAFALRGAFAAVAAQFTIQSDPDGTIAQSLMTTVYGSTATNFYFGLLNNTLVTSIQYPSGSAPMQPVPVQAVIDASGGRLSYDNLGKQLSFAGVLDTGTQAAINAAISANQNVPALHQAITSLSLANEQTVGPFFATYPELLPLYLAYASSTNPVQQKRSALLANFLPTLIQERNQEQALATVSAAAGTDPSYANALMTDASVLHSSSDMTVPLVSDLTALNSAGLAAQIFFSNKPDGQPDLVLDADPASYAPASIAAQQTASIGGKMTSGNVLTTLINGVQIPYTVAAGVQTAASVAAGITSAIMSTGVTDPFSGLPLKDVVSATAVGSTITVQASNAGANIVFNCLVTPASATQPTYMAGAQVPASATATVGGATFTAGDLLTTTINTIPIAYKVAAGDTSAKILAANIAAAINATATADPASGLPIHQLVSASSAASVITVSGKSFGPDITLACSTSAGATETYLAGLPSNAFQTATLSAVPPANDIVVTTINGVAVEYTVTASDATLAGLAANVAAGINANTTIDSITGKALNTVVQASGGGGTIKLSTLPPGVSFTLACSITFGSYALASQVAAWQSAIVSGVIAAGDVLSSTINGTTVSYAVTGTETDIAAVAANMVTAINATAGVSTMVTASSLGGVVLFRASASSAFTLACSVSSGAAASYTPGPQFPACQATVSGGFSTGDLLTTSINGASVAYAITAADNAPATIAAHVAAAINASTSVDPVTGIAVNGLVAASNAGATLTFRSAGPAIVMSCSVSANATEIYAIAGEFPAKPAGASMAGMWSGYLDAPQDGYYNLSVEADPGANVTLSIDQETVDMSPSENGSVWSNQSPITLTAGNLTPINLTVVSLKTSLSVNWQSAGLGWQVIPAGYMYSDTLVDHLQSAYVRFLKAASLASVLSLTADEIAYLGANPSIEVDTTDSDKIIPGVSTFKPASMANIGAHARLVIDAGAAQELTAVAGVGSSTFSASVVNAHDGSAKPFPILSAPDASIGTGWLNCLAVSPIASSSTALLYPAPSISTGLQRAASQTATVGGNVKAGDVLTSTINGVAIPYKTIGTDTSTAILAASIAAAIMADTSQDPNSGLPMNQAISASSAGDVVTLTSTIFGPDFTLACSVSGGATETYTAGSRTQATQTVTLTGVFPEHVEIVMNINSVTLQYKVASTDISAQTLAASVAKAINTTTTVDLATNRPLNGLVSASSSGAVVTLATVSPGLSFTLACSVASFEKVLRDLLDFAAMKAAISPDDEQLLSVLEEPELLSSDGATPQIVKLTGWSASSLQSLLVHFFGTTQLSSLSSIGRLQRVFNAFAIVSSCRISASALLAATTNAPTPATVASLQSALRALYAASDWLGVIQPINDAMRIQQRDALVAYILQQIGNQYAGSLNITTADNLFEFFLIDVETQPPVQTSRIRLALSSVQLFIERVLRNLEPQVQPADIDGSLWTWMKRYRVWQANREVFLWPENWLDEELRDDPSPIFSDVMSALLQGDITDDAAASAYLTYLSSLELVAKLEPCGMYYIPQSDDANETSYVIARTAGAHCKYYFRELQNGSWSAWTEVKIECEEMPLTPIVWNGRLMLFWLKISKSPAPPALPAATGTSLTGTNTSGSKVTSLTLDDLQEYGATAATNQASSSNVVVSAVLCWSEYYNGKWQAQKTSDVHRPTQVDSTTDFDADRNLMQILPVNLAQFYEEATEFVLGKPTGIVTGSVQSPFPQDDPPPLLLSIASLLDGSPLKVLSGGGFVFYNTHSAPVRWEDVSALVSFSEPYSYLSGTRPLSNLVLLQLPCRDFDPVLSYTGGNQNLPTNQAFSARYWKPPTVVNTIQSNSIVEDFDDQLFTLNRIPRIVNSVSGPPDRDAPFLFEDRRNVFYVTSAQSSTLLYKVESYGFGINNLKYGLSSVDIPRLTVNTLPTLVQKTPFSASIAVGGDTKTVVGRYLAQNGNIRVAIGSVDPVTYQGTTLYPSGQFHTIAATPSTTVANSKISTD